MSAIAPPPFDPRELVLPSVLAMLADVATQLEHPTAQTVHLLAQIAQALDSVHLLAPAKLVRSLEQACQPPVPERHASSTTLPATDTAQHLPALVNNMAPPVTGVAWSSQSSRLCCLWGFGPSLPPKSGYPRCSFHHPARCGPSWRLWPLKALPMLPCSPMQAGVECASSAPLRWPLLPPFRLVC